MIKLHFIDTIEKADEQPKHDTLPLEGLYSNKWSEDIIASIGNTLYCFSPTSNNPMESAITFEYIAPNRYKILSDNESENIGEIARFVNDSNGRVAGIK